MSIVAAIMSRMPLSEKPGQVPKLASAIPYQCEQLSQGRSLKDAPPCGMSRSARISGRILMPPGVEESLGRVSPQIGALDH